MVQFALFASDQAQAIRGLGTQISSIINDKYGLTNFTPQIFENTVNDLVTLIGDIRASLLHNNVRVREHAHLGAAFPPPLKIRKVLQRLSNTVHVLCLLVDAIDGGQGEAATQEETSAITDGYQDLIATLAHLKNIFPPPSSGAEID